MRVLVTGIAGFLGPHVAQVLKEQGHDVVGLDLRRGPAPRDLQIDLLKSAALDGALAGMDAVCHLAAIGDVNQAMREPARAAAVNVLGTANLLDACFHQGVKKLVYASTWEVYGRPQYQPIDELHFCNPEHPYSITKLAGEKLALSYDQYRGLSITSLRLGTAYGENMRDNSVISTFTRQARSGGPVTIEGTGMQWRQFTHVRDIGQAFHLALVSLSHRGIFNVVSDQCISVRELAELIISRYPARVVFVPDRSGDNPVAVVSSEKAKTLLGWREEADFRKCMIRMLDSGSA